MHDFSDAPFAKTEPPSAVGDAHRIPLQFDAWMTYEPGWLCAPEADALLDAITAEADWGERPIIARGKEVMQPRLIDWAGDLPYKYSGQVLDPKQHSPTLDTLRKEIEAHVGQAFNHTLLNLYRDGKDSVAMHADNEPELGQFPIIASISLGATRVFRLQSRRDRKRRRRLALEHGSLLVMGGAMQRTWRHAVPKEPAIAEPRLNITFRRLMGPPGWRDPRWKQNPRPSNGQ